MKLRKELLIIITMILAMFMFACVDNPKEPDHECVMGEWEYSGEHKCEEEAEMVRKCTICGEILDIKEEMVYHDIVTETINPTCTEKGKIVEYCKNCNYKKETSLKALGHTPGNYEVVGEVGKDEVGTRKRICTTCKEVLDEKEFANNGYFAHGKLSVKGADLVDQNGDKYQLYGLSTHGLQWYGKYVNYDTIAAVQNEFGINVIRFSFYTGENGYCYGGEAQKRKFKEYADIGIQAATQLGLYIIIDWHMLGADEEEDKNPLTFVEESKEFFGWVTSKYGKQDNILYEIMNEPCGKTTWKNCKDYANQVIPVIRENSDGIVLVGNPKWTADLNSVMLSPLTGYTNIMYTYHFYADDHKDTTQVVNAYKKGFPVFISEYGFMYSDGDGDLNLKSGENWMKVLNDRNISYVAWNISNSGGSSAIQKRSSTSLTDFSDANLKEWGIYLKNMYRAKAGLDKKN